MRASRFFLTVAFGLWQLAMATSPALAEQHVLIVTIDGFPSYLLKDPETPIPTIRRLAREGVVAEGMRVSNPAVTWPNHTTLITGMRPAKHSVLFNGVLIRPEDGTPARIDAKRTRADLVAVPTIMDLAHERGLRTAAINWPCTRETTAIDDNFPDVPEQVTHSTPRLIEALKISGVLPEGTQKSFDGLSAAGRDQVWTEAACEVIRQRKPHLMLLHLLITDTTHHKYGPKTLAGQTALALADSHLRDVLRALEQAGILQDTAIFVTSDHGFATADKVLQPNVLLAREGFLDARTPALTKVKVQVISEGGTALVYFMQKGLSDVDKARARALLENQEGIEEVIDPSRFAGLGYPDPSQNRHMADLVLVAKEGYAFSNNAVGKDYVMPTEFGTHSLGYHGFISSNPKMNATLVAWGKGVKKGGKLPLVDNIGVAPTAARLLGFEIPNADGKAFAEALGE